MKMLTRIFFTISANCLIMHIYYAPCVFSYDICIDPGHGWDTTHPLNGWDNCGPIFDVNGRPYRTLKQPPNLNELPTALRNTIEIPEEEWPDWLELEKNEIPVGLLEYQNTWKIAGYLKK
ncbi:hypothetical protein K8T06_12065 [bacterium]|nr:hypothetical protein [bacterium]